MEKLFDKFASVCKKVCYIVLAALLILVLSERVQAEEEVSVDAVPAAVTVQTETNEGSGMTRVTVYIRTFIQDVQDKYREIVSTTDSEVAELPKAS